MHREAASDEIAETGKGPDQFPQPHGETDGEPDFGRMTQRSEDPHLRAFEDADARRHRQRMRCSRRKDRRDHGKGSRRETEGREQQAILDQNEQVHPDARAERLNEPPGLRDQPRHRLLRSRQHVHLPVDPAQAVQAGRASQGRDESRATPEPADHEREAEHEPRRAQDDRHQRPFELWHAAPQKQRGVQAREGNAGSHLERPVDRDARDRIRPGRAVGGQQEGPQRVAAEPAPGDEGREALSSCPVGGERAKARGRAETGEQVPPA